MRWIAFLLALALIAAPGYAQDDLANDWEMHIQATADAPAGTVTDHTFVISIPPTAIAWWQHVQPDGDDIRVTINGTQVPVDSMTDLATWDYENRNAVIAAKWTGAQTGAPVILVYAGNATATKPGDDDTYGRHNAYGSRVKAFWPLGGGEDRTSNNNDLTANGGVSVGGVAGPITGSLATDFDGTDDYCLLASNGGVTTAPVQLMGSCRPDDADNYHTIVDIHNSASASNRNQFALLWGYPNQNVAIAIASASANSTTTSTGLGNWPIGDWNRGAGNFVSNVLRNAWREGAKGPTGGTQDRTPSGVNQITVGAVIASGGNTFFLDGRASMIFVCSGARTDDEIAYDGLMLIAGDQSAFYNGWTSSVPNVWHLKSDATGDESGIDWENAFTDPDDAAAAMQSGSTDAREQLLTDGLFRKEISIDGVDYFDVITNQGPSGQTIVTNGHFADWTDETGGVWSTAEPVETTTHVVYDLQQDLDGSVTGYTPDVWDIERLSELGIDSIEACPWFGYLKRTTGTESEPGEGEWGKTGGVIYVNPFGDPTEAQIEALTQFTKDGYNGVNIANCEHWTLSGKLRTVFTTNTGGNSGYGVKSEHCYDGHISDVISHLGGWHIGGHVGNSLGGHTMTDFFANTCISDGAGNPFVCTLYQSPTEYDILCERLSAMQFPLFQQVNPATGKAAPLNLNWGAQWLKSHATGSQNNFHGITWRDGYFNCPVTPIETFHGVTNTRTAPSSTIDHSDSTFSDWTDFDGYPCYGINLYFRGRSITPPGYTLPIHCFDDRHGEVTTQRYVDGNALNVLGGLKDHYIITGRHSGSVFDGVGGGSNLTFDNVRVLMQSTNAATGLVGLATNDVGFRYRGIRLESNNAATHGLLKDDSGSAYADNFSGAESLGRNWLSADVDAFAYNLDGTSSRDNAWGQANIVGAERDWQTDFGWGATEEDQIDFLRDHWERTRDNEVSPAVIQNSNQVVQ